MSRSDEPHAKKRRLASKTFNILNENSDLTKIMTEIMKEHDFAFHEYEDENRRIREVLSTLQHRLDASNCQKQSLQQQIINKNAVISRNHHEISALKVAYECMKVDVDSLAMRVFEAEQEKEEQVNHYKDLLKGLQKSHAAEEEASGYLQLLRKIMIDYENGEKTDACIHRTQKYCSICLTEPANICAKPCHHLEWCRGCAQKQFNLDGNCFDSIKTEVIIEPHTCPRCKAVIGCIDYIFI